MRKIILLLMAVLAMQGCNEASEGYTVNISLEGAEGKLVKLQTQENRAYVTMDSIMLVEGLEPVMSGSMEGVKTAYLRIEGEQGSIRLLMENAAYTISGSLQEPLIETSGKAQQDLNEYNAMLKPISEKMGEMRAALQEAFSGDNEDLKESLREEYYALYEKQDELDSAYIADNPASFATVLAMRGTFYNLDAAQLETALAALDTELHQLDEYDYMYGKMVRMKAVAVGQKYTDFELETPEGGSLKISDVHDGQVLLVDFWASWCGPCRRANPELVEIYHDYKDRGFQILGVSLDRDKDSWIKAIDDDNLIWPQISDLKYWNSAGAELYGVPAIPHAVLIDREGTIVAKKLHGTELREKIESLL